MTDKVQKIREEVARLRKSYQIMYQELDCESPELMSVCAKRNLCQDILMFIDSMQEEPVSEDLEEAANEYKCQQALEDYRPSLYKAFKAGAKWQKEQDKETIELAEDHAMFAGMEKMKEQMMKNIWKPADGDDLPEIDREVVVFTQDFPNDAGIMAVAIGHRPNPEGWDGKSLSTGKVEHYTPKTYGKGGWNIPDVKYWLDAPIPEEKEESYDRQRD